MFYFRFTERQLELLKKILDSDKLNFKSSFIGEYFVLENHSDIEKCFDYILDYFVCNGLDQNDEASKIGIEIENVNQIINHQLVLNNSEKDFSENQSKQYFKAKKMFLKCNGNINDLDNENKKIYMKLNIPSWLEENWGNYLENKKIEEKFKTN